MDDFKAKGQLPVPEELAVCARDDFGSAAVSEEEILSTIASVAKEHDYVLCPHSATAMKASLDLAKGGEAGCDIISLATAHVGKFADAVKSAVPGGVTLPRQLAELHGLEARKQVLDATGDAVRQYVDETLAAPSAGS